MKLGIILGFLFPALVFFIVIAVSRLLTERNYRSLKSLKDKEDDQ
jgi:hypothetical protein